MDDDDDDDDSGDGRFCRKQRVKCKMTESIRSVISVVGVYFFIYQVNSKIGPGKINPNGGKSTFPMIGIFMENVERSKTSS